MPATEATKLLRSHQWREGDVALLEAAAARLGLVGVEKPAASFPGGAALAAPSGGSPAAPPPPAPGQSRNRSISAGKPAPQGPVKRQSYRRGQSA